MSQVIFRPKEDQDTWNFALSVLFLLITVGLLYYMWRTYGTFPQSVSVFDAILMALATFRITRLVVYDKITRWARNLFVQKIEFERGGETWYEIRPYEKGLLGTLHHLLGCPWCISFWSAFVISFSYFMFPWAWYIIFFVALSGAGSFMQLLANMIGWKAENLKQDSHQKEEHSKRQIDFSSLGE